MRGRRRPSRPIAVIVAGAATFLVGLGPAGRGAPPASAQAVPTDGVPLCGVATPTGAVVAAEDDGVLRVATLNLLHSETDEGDESLGLRLELLADAVVDARADVVGAQEVTRNRTFDPTDEAPQRHGVVAERLAGAIAARTGEPWSWCWSLSNPHVPGTPDLFPGGGNPLDEQAAANGNLPDPGDFSEGLAVLSRFPVERASFRRLLPRSYEAVGCLEPDPFCPLNAIFDSRQVLFTRLAAPGGGLDLFSTHVAHHLTELSDETKLVQAQQIVSIVDDLATNDDAFPDVLVGDFNSTPSSRAVATLLAAGFVDGYAAAGGVECGEPDTGGCSGGPATGAEVWTADAVRPMSERIDYVFLRPPSGCELRVASASRIADVPQRVDDGRYLWPSDHYGFVAEPRCLAPVGSADVAPTAPAAAPQPGPSGELPATGSTTAPGWGIVVAIAALGLGRVVGRRTALRR